MRIISQDGIRFDIEYENCHLTVNNKTFEIEAETSNPNFTPVIASYSSLDRCKKAMDILHSAYCGLIYPNYGDYEVKDIDLAQEFEKKIKEEMKKLKFLEIKPNDLVVNCKVFRFPTNEELEG